MMTFCYYNVKVKGQDLGHCHAKLLKRFLFSQNVFTFLLGPYSQYFDMKTTLVGLYHPHQYAVLEHRCISFLEIVALTWCAYVYMTLIREGGRVWEVRVSLYFNGKSGPISGALCSLMHDARGPTQAIGIPMKEVRQE